MTALTLRSFTIFEYFITDYLTGQMVLSIALVKLVATPKDPAMQPHTNWVPKPILALSMPVFVHSIALASPAVVGRRKAFSSNRSLAPLGA